MPGIKYGPPRPVTRRAAPKPSDDLLPLERKDERGRLFPSHAVDPSWVEVWKGMPTYEMGNTEAARKVIVYFRSDDEVEEFGRLIGVDVSERTETIWFTPDENYIAPKTLLYVGSKNFVPRYPVYIPSVGRWETPLTARALDAIGVPYRVVVEPAQRDDYARALGEEKLLILPHDYSKHNTGSFHARNWIWKHSLENGAIRHWVIDDNVRKFMRMNRNRRLPVGDGAIFRAAEDFSDRYENVALSGFGYMYLYGNSERQGTIPPYNLNTRVYSMILVNNSIPYRWRGRYNEDTDICLRALKDGWCTVLFNAFLGDKVPTLTMGGGNTDTVYATGDRRLEFARSLERQHPDVAKVVWRYGRWHHDVDYTRFSRNRLIEKADRAAVEDPEYGMRLVRSGRSSRYPKNGA